jgi:hypothetical protein
MTIIAHEPQLKQETLKPPAKIGESSITNWDNKQLALSNMIISSYWWRLLIYTQFNLLAKISINSGIKLKLCLEGASTGVELPCAMTDAPITFSPLFFLYCCQYHLLS